MSQGAIKQCVACGELCANRPRVRDRHGRYLCKPCHDKLEASYKLPAGAYDVEPIDNKPKHPNLSGMTCPSCGGHIPPKGVLCVGCGFSLATGAKVEQSSRPHEGAFMRDEWCEHDSRETARLAYMTPAIVAAVSFAAMIWLAFENAGAVGVVPYLGWFGVQLAVGIVVYLACCYTFIGVDAPLPLLLLQVVAAFAANNVTSTLMGSAGLLSLWYFSVILYFMVFTGLLMWLTDIEFTDALIVAVLFVIAIVATSFAIAALTG